MSLSVFRNFCHFISVVRALLVLIKVPSLSAVAGLSNGVINERAAHVLSQIEANAPNKERYSLLAKTVNGGVALLVYGLDDGIARNVFDVQTAWTSCGPFHMSNKGAVSVRFRVSHSENDAGEIYT